MPTSAERWQAAQRQVSDATAVKVLAAWARVRLADPQRTFAAALPELLAAVLAGQVTAAAAAQEYVASSLVEQGVTPRPVAAVEPRRLAGVASDGRPLIGLLTQPLLRSLALRARGADDAAALAGGRLSLDTVVRTEVLDTGRDAVSLAVGLEPQVVGYERYVNLPACGRCLLLAGRVYSRSEGFRRHPRCDCVHRVLTDRAVRDGTEQDPRSLFDGMTATQQDKAFGAVNAEVIRRGGDISRVVNARRGMATAGSNWTTEGVTRGRRTREVVRRPSPGALLKFAGDDPEKFATALARAGYL